MLSSFSVKNFKSIGERAVTLDLKPLTVLVGPNGSGKSSILHALAVISQSLKQGQLRHHAELVKFNSTEDLIHKNETDRWLSFELVLAEEELLGFRYEWRHDTGEAKQSVIKNQKDLISIELAGDRWLGWDFIAKLPDGRTQNKSSKSTGYSLPILEYSLFDPGAWIEKWPELDEAKKIGIVILEKLGEKIFFISSYRGKIPFHAEAATVPERHSWVGAEGERLIPLLSFLTSPRYDEITNQIINWSGKFGLLKLSAGARGPGILKAEYRDPLLNAPLNLALASQGSRQILSIIIQLFISPRSLVMIEEPEISLHPEGQVEIVRLFADAIKNNKQQIIISTHSHFLQLALGIVVQEGLLKADDIALYEVKKDKEGTKANKMKLSQRGFPIGWPSSFDKIEKMVAREWFKGLEK